ncbi:MAG: MMPL family transporter [Myxococcales bacterium]
MFRRWVGNFVDAAGRHPAIVLLLAALFTVSSWGYATKLQLRSDFLELLPRDSPGFKAYEHQLGRVGGGASFTVVLQSPDRKANERFIDALSARLDAMVNDSASCEARCSDDRCKRACPPNYILYFENGTREVHDFFQANKWLYASQKDLEDADRTLEMQIGFRSGLVEKLEDDVPSAPSEKKPALGMDEHRDRWESSAKKYDEFPSGYFASPDGTLMVLRIISRASGTGEASGDVFSAQMARLIADLKPKEFHPELHIGFAGDIPNATEEKQSIMSEAIGATALALVLVLGGIVIYYRSGWSLIVVGIPAIMGIGGAYAFATATFGYVNTPGAFLGAIILGNGVNYPIVLLSRYREFRARGMEPTVARREAVLNAFRAELVGASVASIAYGSLTITRFRGFSQFGTIGFLGMFLVWLSIVPVVPALVVTIEWIQSKLPWYNVEVASQPRGVELQFARGGFFVRFAGWVTERWPWALVLLFGSVTLVAVWKLPGFLRDPWEYNFHHLGSKGSRSTGAGEWSNKADSVFQGKMDISGARMLADGPEQVAGLKAQILANDARDGKGQLIEKIVTIGDFLPGTLAEQKARIEVLDRIRDRLTDTVLYGLNADERKRVEELRPPETLGLLEGKDLPALIRRRFEENNGAVGTLFYVQYKFGVSMSDGHTLLRIAKTTDNITLPDGTLVQTASRATVFAEMIRSMERDGPLATGASFLAVLIVVLIATHNIRGAFAVIGALTMGVACTVGFAAWLDAKLNFLNFIALPITFGIGCEYPFNIYDRTRLLKGDITAAVTRSGGAVALCSYTTIVGYGSLLVADNQALESFGKLAMFGEVACIATALFFLPALLHLLRRLKAPSVSVTP